MVDLPGGILGDYNVADYLDEVPFSRCKQATISCSIKICSALQEHIQFVLFRRNG